jgi:mono/diheme cytochrome c family protein
MNVVSHVKAIAVAVLAGAIALGSTLSTAAVWRRHALKDSHAQPSEERWLEPAVPDSPLLRTHGRELFLDSCAHCHGADARGDEGPDLHGVQVSDRYIATIITRGIPHEMPSFAKKHGRADITALTAYLRSLE